MNDRSFEAERQQMVADIVAHTVFVTGRLGKASLDRRVLDVMGRVPRHAFVPASLLPVAYGDMPLPVGHGKTVSQPFIVALMTDLLELQPEHEVLEIGTGVGYQTAVLAALVRHVYSIELIEPLATRARRQLAAMGLAGKVDIRVGDGHLGWPEHAPFARIIVTAAPEHVPRALIDQLAPGGRIVIPAGPYGAQQLVVLTKDAAGHVAEREVLQVSFSALDTPQP